MPEFLFDGKQTLAALHSLADLLATRAVDHQTLIVVGGSYLALHELRESTRDIDSVTRLDEVTKQAILEIAQQHRYPNNWLNDAAAAFRPTGLGIENCAVLFEHQALTILGPSADWIFLMKLYAGRTIDHQDLSRLWPIAPHFRSMWHRGGFRVVEVPGHHLWARARGAHRCRQFPAADRCHRR